jgi:hypothetical protein
MLSSQLDYCGTIKEILEVGYRKFSVFILDVKWFRVIYNGPNATVRRDENGFFAEFHKDLVQRKRYIRFSRTM